MYVCMYRYTYIVYVHVFTCVHAYTYLGCAFEKKLLILEVIVLLGNLSPILCGVAEVSCDSAPSEGCVTCATCEGVRV